MKKVEIKGFKSIAKKISLTLAEGVTCIAGPNGCGKSNLIDAIRWALGEQSIRSLRAGSMSDVIFAGTQDTYQGSLAQVNLEFIRDGGYFPKSLEGFDEVSISRRLYRTGESVYSINNVKCRLKDITDIFLDTGLDRHGYAIIEQGKVKDIIQSKPEDIRYIIEEAAEVGKFRVKRADAMKRLEATSKNLERIRDLLSEVSRQKDDLRSQANKAKRYQAVRTEINDLTRDLWAYELNAITAAQKKLEEEKQELDSQIRGFERQHQEYVTLMGSSATRLAALKEKIDAASSSLREANSRTLLAQGDIDANQEREKDIGTTLSMLRARVDQMKGARENAQEEYEEGSAVLKNLSDEIARVQAELTEGQEEVEERYVGYKALEDDYNQGRAELFDAIGQARAIAQRLSSMNTRYHEVISSTKKRTEDLDRIREKKDGLTRRLKDVEQSIDSIKTAQGEIESVVQSVSEETQALETTIAKEARFVVGMEKDHAEHVAKISILERIINAGSKVPSEEAKRSNGTRKVFDTLKVHEGYEETVGRSMGEALDFVIIQDLEEVPALLMREDASPGYILKQPHLNGILNQALTKESGVIGPLRDCMEVQEGFEDIANALTRDMWVVEDIHCALALWKQGLRSGSFVTKEGIIVEPTGAIRTMAEMTKYAESLKAKAEKDELTIQLQSLEQAIAEAKTRLEKFKSGLVALKEKHTEATQQADVLKREQVAFAETRNETLRELERITEREDSYGRDIAEWEDMAGRLQGDIKEISTQKDRMDVEIEASQSRIKTLDEKKQAAKEVYEKAQGAIQTHISRLNELKVTHASRMERAQGIRENLAKMLQEIEKDNLRIVELQQTESSIATALSKSRADLSRAEQDIKELEKLKEELLPEFDEMTDTMHSLSESRDQCKDSIDHLEKSRNSCVLKQKEQEISFAMSRERLESRFGKELPAVPDSFSPDEAREKAAMLEKRIERMGQINFASIDAYENVQGRWDDLHRQYEDIVQASTRLKEVIANIERQSTKAFMATFKQVRANFQEIFTTIFGGGTADIVLTDKEGMEAGVEIFASPPFKRLKAMTLLSEGEKTLCALSFIFALFKVRPSPFCILDEVDAPLDDSNVIRFNRLIRSFSKDSQFIIVTHNRYTMEMADIIYGVTFDVPGISKVVSLLLQDMEG